jgi:hypothetical protein
LVTFSNDVSYTFLQPLGNFLGEKPLTITRSRVSCYSEKGIIDILWSAQMLWKHRENGTVLFQIPHSSEKVTA